MSLPPTDIRITVQPEDFDLAAELSAMRQADRGIGAVAAFVGLVRDLNLAADVTALELEHYPGMTERALHTICDEAAVRWPLHAVRVIHRVGKLHPGDQIVLVLTASAHRHAAYESNAFVMDYLKTRAPFWKKEWTPDGPRWIEARESDQSAATRWHDIVAHTYGNTDHD
ncbi:MAG: molybdopterin synthase catalytic subunit MoaE [Burkholderiales bacterium]|nr:molybdopterin synthase catalytic subunit MoaE [Burkholderiales bacterium]